jgi:hypothetical protein
MRKRPLAAIIATGSALLGLTTLAMAQERSAAASGQPEAAGLQRQGDGDRRAALEDHRELWRGERRRVRENGERFELAGKVAARLSRGQLERLRRGLDVHDDHLRVTKLNARVGDRLPRDLRSLPISEEITDILPEDRSYRYVVLDDRVCIVDPATYEIVDVIDRLILQGLWPKSTLDLTQTQRAAVLASLAPDVPEVGPLRLGLGEEVPTSLVLHGFPDVVFDRAPQLQFFQFLLTAEDVIIVEPRRREIALIIARE